MISNVLPTPAPPTSGPAVATPENPPVAPKPGPVETTETSRKVEETGTMTKPTRA